LPVTLDAEAWLLLTNGACFSPLFPFSCMAAESFILPLSDYVANLQPKTHYLTYFVVYILRTDRLPGDLTVCGLDVAQICFCVVSKPFSELPLVV
jgi:hypothetical protein